MKVDIAIDKYKTRLIVKSFEQKNSCFDIYSLVSRVTYIKMLIVSISINKLEIQQTCTKPILLNGDLDKEIYIKYPKGFVNRQFVFYTSLLNHYIV